MNKVIAAIKKGVLGIAHFSGRSSRTDFWIYAIFVFLLAFGAWSTVMSMEMARTIDGVQQYAAANPGKVTINSGPTGVSYSIKDGASGVGPDFTYLLASMSVIALVSIVLLAAAAVRRLHDSERTGLWVLLPIPFLFSGLWLMWSMFDGFNANPEPEMGLFALGFVNNLIYLGTLGCVGFLLLRSGSAGANRFGERKAEEIA
jgi:uncharacterized membrane protein YhaH (DUF805 family)